MERETNTILKDFRWPLFLWLAVVFCCIFLYSFLAAWGIDEGTYNGGKWGDFFEGVFKICLVPIMSVLSSFISNQALVIMLSLIIAGFFLGFIIERLIFLLSKSKKASIVNE